MDNNFENNTGNQPQRPFTERPEQAPPTQPFDFEPEKPLMQQPEEQPKENDEQGFDPIEQTATYQDGAFNQVPRSPQYAQPPQYGPQMQYPQQGFGVQPPLNAMQNNYSNPGYYNNAYPLPPQGFVQPMQQPVPQPMAQPVPGQQFVSPLQSPGEDRAGFGAVPAQPNRDIPASDPQNDYAAPKKQKPKANKGMLIVIIVLALMLAASFIGIIYYAVSNSGSKNTSPVSDNGSNSDSFRFPDYQNPGSEQPATEAPVFDQSDYSDKVQDDYKGLDLGKKPADANTNKSYGSEYAFKKASPSVVGVKGFSDKDKKTKISEGSGIIISEDGYVLTNAHVVSNSKTSMLLSVYTSDGKEYNAGVVGFDSRTDVALLKLDDAKGLTPAQFGDSNQLQQGEDILIVGNPGGMDFQNSMTKGIVSALERDASAKSIVKYIQTDAAINPGNSGGPAVNMYGQVVGIATSKIVDESYEGMGFCIPSATVKTIVDSLMKYGYVENRVKIGISGIAVTSQEAAQYDIPSGILVQTVDPEGPCGKTDIKAGDVIYEADGQDIKSFSDIYKVLENHKEGDKITIKYYSQSSGSRSSFEEKEAEIELQVDKG